MTESSPGRYFPLPACVMVARPEPLNDSHFQAIKDIHGIVPAFHYDTLRNHPIEKAIPGLEILFKDLFVYTDSALVCATCTLEAKRTSTKFGFFELTDKGVLKIYHWDGSQFALIWTGRENPNTTDQALP